MASSESCSNRILRGCGGLSARLRPVALAGVLLLLPLASDALAAQDRQYTPEERRWLDAGWEEDVGFAAANAVVTGLVTGLFQKLADGGSFRDGFLDGATAGVVTYGGKRIAAQRFWGAGLLGRQVASVGASLAANAREGRGPFDRLIIQVGLGRLYWDRSAGTLTIRPDVVTLYYTTLAIADSRAELDWSRSLSAGAPIFVTSTRGSLDGNAAGRAFGGMAILDMHARIPLDDIGAHERVHILQHDQHFALWAEPVERAAASLLGEGPSAWLGRVDLGLALLSFAPLVDVLPRGQNPIEIEADFLTVR